MNLKPKDFFTMAMMLALAATPSCSDEPSTLDDVQAIPIHKPSEGLYDDIMQAETASGEAARDLLKDVSNMTDTQYGELRVVVKKALVANDWTVFSKMAPEHIGLGRNGDDLVIESEAEASWDIKIHVRKDNTVEIRRLDGGEALVDAMKGYLIGLGTNDALQRLLTRDIKLPYMMALLSESFAENDMNLAKYAHRHDFDQVPRKVLKMEVGKYKGKYTTVLNFNQLPKPEGVLPTPGASFRLFSADAELTKLEGVIVDFSPSIHTLADKAAAENRPGTGACVRACVNATRSSCVQETTSAACLSEEVFSKDLRCPTKVSWYQELNNCGLAGRAFRVGLDRK